jgi:ribosome maturation factor RimP
LPTFLFLGVKTVAHDDEVEERQSLEARITSLAEQVAAPLGMEIVLAEVRGGGSRSIVRIFIDKPGGISLSDCESFSKRLSVRLDVEDWIPFSYALEVSSPGIDRRLVKEADFQRFAGKEAKIRLRAPIEGQKKLRGRIVGVAQGRLQLEVNPGKQVELALSDIEKANLVGEI